MFQMFWLKTATLFLWSVMRYFDLLLLLVQQQQQHFTTLRWSPIQRKVVKAKKKTTPKKNHRIR